MSRFERTRRALVVFDQGAGARNALWAGVSRDDELRLASLADARALAAVRSAFLADTATFNTADGVALADIAFMRGCAEREITPTRA